MNITISLDNLDSAIKQIEELQSKLESFTAELADETKVGIAYPGVSVNHNGSGSHTIIAEDDNIAFMEFGAGYVADYEEGFQEFGGDNFHTEPGIWSESHRRTFQHHQASGKAPSTYRYNRVPQNRMQRTAMRLIDTTPQKAKDYFK